MSTEQNKLQRTEVGRVLSNKMQQSATVVVERRVKHPMYGKYIRRSKKYHVHDAENVLNIGDLVQIYRKLSGSKRGTWSQPTPVLAYNPQSQCVTVTGSHGRQIEAAIEDTRFSVDDQLDLASIIQSAIDQHADSRDLEMENNALDDTATAHEHLHSINNIEESDDEDFETPTQTAPAPPSPDHSNPAPTEHPPMSFQADVTYKPEHPSTYDPDYPHNQADLSDIAVVIPGDRVGQRELNALGPASLDEPQMRTRSNNAHEIELEPGAELSSAEQDNLMLYRERFKSKEFLKHHAQGLPTCVVENA